MPLSSKSSKYSSISRNSVAKHLRCHGIFNDDCEKAKIINSSKKTVVTLLICSGQQNQTQLILHILSMKM